VLLNKSRIRDSALATIAGVALLALASGASAQQAFDWKKFAGSSVNVSLKKVPWTDSLLPHIAEFEALTGIKAKIEVLPENQQREKLTVALTSGGTDVDVYDTQRHNEGLKYFLAGWYDPIDKYLKDQALTSPNLGYPSDLLQSAIDDSTIQGTLTGMPIYTETIVVAYRKDLFEAAHLGVPDTLDELEEAAKKLTDKTKGQFGICLRGLGVAASGIVGSFFYGTGGQWTDDTFAPALTTPGAVKGFELYGRLAREYGPPGVLNYHWFQCQSLFASGKAAMWVDANSVFNPLLDPAKSQVADKTAFAVFPNGPGGRHPGFGTHALAIFPKSQNKGPAWYFIQWAAGAEMSLTEQLQGVPSARKSPWASEQVQKDQRYAQLRDITLKTMQLDKLSSFSPPWVAVGEVRDIIGVVVVVAIQGGDVKAALEEAARQIQEVRKKTEKQG
jgi:multiple sugar transport system substrate-binding protein